MTNTKKTLMAAALLVSGAFTANAQVVTDSVSTGASYANQVWYSLDNGVVKTEPRNNWDIAFAATSNPASSLATSIWFNPEVGTLYEVQWDSLGAFKTLDTTGLSWTPLYNSDTTWAKGAFNNTSTLGGLDYGWGTYTPPPATHGIWANRAFVIKYTNGSYKKLHITFKFNENGYTLVYDDLENSDSKTQLISLDNTKNFVYYSLTNNTIVDREPATANWDLFFGRYVSSYGTASNQTVTGLLQNLGVEAVRVDEVNQETYTDYASHTFSARINSIGSDWKKVDMSGPPYPWVMDDSTVFFVKKNSNGDIWKIVFTGFGGSGTGTYHFTKEKIHNVSVKNINNTNVSLAVYPNPASGSNVNILYDIDGNSSNVSLTLMDLTGKNVHTQNLSNQSGLNNHTLDVSTLNKGMYIVYLNIDGQKIQQKLIVN